MASDFHIFPNLHMYLGGKKLLSNQEVKSVVNLYLKKLDKSLYHTGIEKWCSDTINASVCMAIMSKNELNVQNKIY